jgi:hypothetical protein
MSDSPPINCAHDAIVPVAELKPNPENPNKHPKEQLELYVKILLHQGWRKAICVSNQTGLIVTGHGAWLTANHHAHKARYIESVRYPGAFACIPRSRNLLGGG